MERKRPKPPSPVNTQQEEPTPPKHAKLVLKPPKFITSKLKDAPQANINSLLEDILQLETAEDVLEQLLGLLDSCKLELLLEQQGLLNSEEVAKCIGTIGKLAKLYRGDVCVCCVLVHVVEVCSMKLRSSSEGYLPKSLQLFVLSLIDHDNADVKVSVLKCLSKMVGQYSDKTTFIEQALELAQNTVHNPHHGVRVECLKLIGQLCHVTSCEAQLDTLEDHCADSDPRVRSAAFQALYQVHGKNPESLPLSVYTKASESLTDKSSEVRTRAVRLVWALGLRYANKVVPLRQESSVELRLLDDAFIKICDLVNDSSMPVRALAAQLLGDFHEVDHKFLEQTLDKKLMSHLKIVKSDHQRQRELHQAGGGASMDWDSGVKWASSAPKMVMDPGEMSLMSAGACGAFVHGLEDEFMEVRSAAVGSMCQLGMQSRRFAALSIDYLVDMFNDEIEGVRLKAISSLCQISSVLELREDQLETVLSVLEESASVIRDALREMLSSCRITTSAGLNTTVRALLDNLKKYPHDYQSIWSCLRHLGSNHGYLVSSLVPELLSTHSFFMGKEPDMDDPAYICILILVFNAAACCPTIPPLFPSHVFRHYTYLRDTLPHLIPSITIGMPSALKLTHTRKQEVSCNTQFLEQVLSRARRSANLPSGRGGHSTLLTCIKDLLKMADLNKTVAGMAKVAATFLQCQLLISKVQDVLSQDVLLTSDTSSHHSVPTITSSIRELLLLSYRVEHLFAGLSPLLAHKCHMVRLSAHAMSLMLAVHLDFDTEHSSIFAKMKQGFMERLQKVRDYCHAHSVPLPSFLTPLSELNFATVATETLTDSLQPLTSSQFCSDLPLDEVLGVKESEAELLEPQSSSREDFIKFVSSLALSVHVDASLRNVVDPDSLAILVNFPDDRQLLFPIKPCEVRSTSAGESRLDTSVILSHGLWSDPSQVEFSVVRRFSSDVGEACCLPFTSLQTKPALSRSAKAAGGGGARVVQGGCGIPTFPSISNPVHSQREDSLEGPGTGRGQDCVLAISRVVRVNVQPQEKLNNTFNVF